MKRTGIKGAAFALGLWGAILTGCTTSYPPDIQTYESPISGRRTDFIVDNQLESKDQTDQLLWLNASRMFQDSFVHDYYLEITYATTADRGYLDIGRGVTLVVTADGKEMRFDGSGSINLRKKKGGLLNETALYRAQDKDLVAIGNARQVKVKVTGKNGVIEREFSTVNAARFKKFADQFITPGL